MKNFNVDVIGKIVKFLPEETEYVCADDSLIRDVLNYTEYYKEDDKIWIAKGYKHNTKYNSWSAQTIKVTEEKFQKEVMDIFGLKASLSITLEKEWMEHISESAMDVIPPLYWGGGEDVWHYIYNVDAYISLK